MDEAGVGSDAMDTVATGTAGSQARQDVKKPFQESQRERRLRMENTQLKKRLTANQAGAQKLKESNQVLRGENRSLQVEKALAVCRNRAARLLKEAADTLPEDLKPFVFDEMKHRDERAQRGIIKKYQALVGVRGGYESVDGAGGKDVSGLRESGAAGASSDFGSFLNQRGVPLKAN